jgi:hypothetical protein
MNGPLSPLTADSTQRFSGSRRCWARQTLERREGEPNFGERRPASLEGEASQPTDRRTVEAGFVLPGQ